MSNIIAGDPAPTNPQAEAAVRSLINGGYGERQAREIIAHVAGEASEGGYHRACRQLLGDDLNPSNLILDSQSYRRLVERIEATMTEPDQWDGDDAEVEILARYVEWLAAGSPTEDGWPVIPAGGAR